MLFPVPATPQLSLCQFPMSLLLTADQVPREALNCVGFPILLAQGFYLLVMSIQA